MEAVAIALDVFGHDGPKTMADARSAVLVAPNVAQNHASSQRISLVPNGGPTGVIARCRAGARRESSDVESLIGDGLLAFQSPAWRHEPILWQRDPRRPDERLVS